MARAALVVNPQARPRYPRSLFYSERNSMSLAASAQVALMTRDGHDRLNRELAALKTQARYHLAGRLQIARGNGGDPADNGELMDALEEQALLECQIAALETLLVDACI